MEIHLLCYSEDIQEIRYSLKSGPNFLTKDLLQVLLLHILFVWNRMFFLSLVAHGRNISVFFLMFLLVVKLLSNSPSFKNKTKKTTTTHIYDQNEFDRKHN